MLVIRTSQKQVFDKQLLSNFTHELRIALANKYPHILHRFPEKIQDKIVFNMLGRAKSFGITWQSAFVTFAELMLAIAPNFYQEAHICQVLSLKSLGADRAMQSIMERVPDDAWTSAEASAEDLPLFVPPEALDASLIEQTVAAIPLVLWDFSDQISPLHLAQKSYEFANTLNVGEEKDAPLVLAAWRMLYGSNFHNSNVNPWISDITNTDRTPRERVAMLKFRIALDHGRMV